MNKIAPLRAIIYNQAKIRDLSRVVCPPYDIISASGREYYQVQSPYNLIHILLGKDIPQEDKYIRAENYFKDWLKNKILIQDEKKAMYFYSQQYNLKGEKKVRLGFISLLGLDEKNESVFGHEHTRLEPKEDRLKLLKQVRANLSPIFVVFADNKRIIQRIFQQHIQDKPPLIDLTDDEKVTHKLWRLDSPGILSNIERSMSGENIFIADGHHRYEVACAYRDEMKQNLGKKFTGEESFNYILAYFTNTDSRGLTILPVHRLLRLDSEINPDTLMPRFKEYFKIQEVKDKTRFFFLLEKGGRTEHILGMYQDRKFMLLRLKNIGVLDKLIGDKPKAYRSLDVCILNHIILKNILGRDSEKQENLSFSPDADDFIAEADNDSRYIAFFLDPVKVGQIISVALSGQRFPAKSTYFYPKVLSGLVINKFE